MERRKEDRKAERRKGGMKGEKIREKETKRGK